MQIFLFIVGFLLFVAGPLIHMSFIAALVDLAINFLLLQIAYKTAVKLYARGQNEQNLGFVALLFNSTASFLAIASFIFHLMLLFGAFTSNSGNSSSIGVVSLLSGYGIAVFFIGPIGLIFMPSIAKRYHLSKIASMQKREREAAANKPTLADRLRDMED